MKPTIILLAAAAALPACSTGSGEVKLGVDIAATQAALVAAVNATGTQTSDDPALELNRVRVLMAVAKVGYAGGSQGEAEVGPYVIDLTSDEIANGAHREFSLGTLPSGTYGGAEIEIDAVPSDADLSDTSFGDFRTSQASVIVDGTYLSNAFSFAGHFLAEQGTDGDVTVDETAPVTLSLSVDPSSWFLDSSGAALDPTSSALHDTLAVAICTTLDTEPGLDAPSGHPGGHSGDGHSGGGEHSHCVEGQP
jgi:hypothetical protein